MRRVWMFFAPVIAFLFTYKWSTETELLSSVRSRLPDYEILRCVTVECAFGVALGLLAGIAMYLSARSFNPRKDDWPESW